MTHLPDGSIRFRRNPEGWNPAYFRQDPDDPLHWIPIYPTCKYRRALTVVTPCNKTVYGGEFCDYHAKLTSAPMCSECKIEGR